MDYAVIKLMQKAEQGDTLAQTALAEAYLNGSGVEHNEAEAIRWWRRAADQGFAGAQSDLGSAYATGRDVKQNGSEAV